MRSSNARDWDTFDAYHDQSDVVVYWPGRECTPTRGGPDHRAESERFCAAFPDNKVRTFTGPLELPDGTVIEPTGKSFEVVFSTITAASCSRSASPRTFVARHTATRECG
jgi:hypothetical protein